MTVSLSNAIAAHQAGDMTEAEHLYRTILDADASNADALALLGVVVSARGAFDEAITYTTQAIELDPKAGILRFHQGTVLMAAQKVSEAVNAFQKAVELQPHTPHIHFNFANALRTHNEWPRAIDHYKETLRLDPAFLEAYNNLALSLVHEKDYEGALHYALRAVAIDAHYGDGWLTLSNVCEKMKDYGTALFAGKRSTELLPHNHYAWFGYGIALNRVNRDHDAIKAYEKALTLDPSRADIWDNLAQTYQSLNRLEDAEKAFRKAVEVSGQSIQNEDQKNIDESEFGDRHWHLALIELLRGDYKRGFSRYRARVNAIKELKRLTFPFPFWKGENIEGKRILVCDEQGYGDTLMLARFLKPLYLKGASVVVSIHPVLLPLFGGLKEIETVITHGQKVPPCDFVCSFFDLPHLLGITLETLPQKTPYLPECPPDASTRLVSAKPKIGVVWGGSPLHLADAKRSVPLSVMANLFSLSQVSFYSLNRDFKPKDVEILQNLPVENLGPKLSDFGVAAQYVSQMDLVITCDTATAHLAGALAKKTWLLLPFAPDWRWLTDRDDSPWYPTLRLFRQPQPTNWESPVASVKKALEELYPSK